jgi:myo-inositol 2-dehydrogenase/D-chiro-inositol 1-dehydrogenase
MAEPVRVGMIGVGRHARQVLLPALLQTADLRLVCACTAHEESARQVEETFRLPCYVGYEAMLREAEIEGVLVVGGRHEPQIMACLEADKHVFCETLGISTHAGARDIIRLRDEKKKVVEIGFCLRYAPVYQTMKSSLGEWRRSDPSERMVVVHYYPYIHHFYNLLLFLNGEIRAVLVHSGENQQIISLQFANGDIGAIIARNFHNVSAPYETVEVSGMGGVLRAREGNHLLFHHTETPVSSPSNREFRFDLAAFSGFHPPFSLPYGSVTQLYQRGYVPELEDFARCVRTGEAPVSTVEEAEKNVSVSEAVTAAKQQGGWVEVAYPAPRS